MRRHAEGLVILSGRPSGRTWRRPVPVVDVARAAVAEIEDYTRVRVAPLPPVAVVGAAVADIIHLFAELIENATVFSPPELPVQVRGELVVHGFVLEIEDRGLGIDDDETLAGINERLAEPPEFDLFDSARLGLFVVARLAQRHGVKVTLRRSAYGGTTAIVLIPSGIITVLPDDGPAAEVVTSSLNRTQPVGDDATAG
jgi:signal transduction histidine kinase